MTTMPFLYRFRDAVASLPSLLILAVLIITGLQKTLQIIQPQEESIVQINLAEPEPISDTPIPTQPVEEHLPQPITKQSSSPVIEHNEAPTSNPDMVATSPPPPPVAHPAAAAPAPAITSPTQATEAVKPNNVTIEASYVAQLRAHLNSIKRYPTGREASQQKPRGKVKVWFILNRNGSVADQGIEETSNSMLLDDAARKTINRSSFSSFPESGWPGEATHRFSAELEFIPAG